MGNFFETWNEKSYIGSISQSIENLFKGTYVLKAVSIVE